MYKTEEEVDNFGLKLPFWLNVGTFTVNQSARGGKSVAHLPGTRKLTFISTLPISLGRKRLLMLVPVS